MSRGTKDLELTRLFPVSQVVAQAPGTAPVEGERIRIGSATDNDLVLPHEGISRYHAEVSGTERGVAVRDLGSTNGTRIGELEVTRATATSGCVLTLGQTQVHVAVARPSVVRLHEATSLGGLHGASPLMRRLFGDIDKAARGDLPVLLTGESGTGKELVARALHERGPRAAGPFVTVDGGALAPTLVASELFGHERGAFTGADQPRRGAFERAHGGTLFLDEVGELGPSLQSSLLGVLERGRFQRVGGNEDIAVDVRVVAATHRDLHEEVNTGGFRLDLYYRLAVLRLTVPPLRERRGDIPLLIDHFLEELGVVDGEALFSQELLDELAAHAWPGNVRELRNVVESTVAMGRPASLRPPSSGSTVGMNLDAPYGEARAALLHDFESRYLGHLLDKAGGNVSEAARLARMNRSHLFTLLKRHGLR